VDLERLREVTDGTEAGLRELVNLYLDQTTGQLAQLARAVAENQPGEVRRIAHSCAGASATCGMTDIVPLLRELERQGFEGRLTTAEELLAGAQREFARLRDYLAPYSSAPNPVAQPA
jgi:HPt (histidine-containing phosphotransfer) domain-containing protein